MAERISPSHFHRRDDVPDWRFVLGRIEASFTAESFDKGAAFVKAVADAAEAADHHPDIDLRYPGRAHIRLTTHSEGGVTDKDVELAQAISRLAADHGMTSDPTKAAAVEVAIDAIDIPKVKPFWRAVLGYVDDSAEDVVLRDPNGVGPQFWFQQMDEPRPQRNRIHIDVSVPHDLAEERVQAALDAGGVLVTDQYARSFWVLADAEGNEACVCTWQDRD